jgi:DNA-binding response OmpR family regulator
MSHILIIEDNRDIALLYQRALFQHQHTVVDSAEAAIRHLQQRSFDLIVLDMHLPEASGLQVLKFVRVHSHDDRTKIVVVSADDMFREQCRVYGIQGWMTKPIELDVFMDLVADQLAKTS